jgi:hypothetical protein
MTEIEKLKNYINELDNKDTGNIELTVQPSVDNTDSKPTADIAPIKPEINNTVSNISSAKIPATAEKPEKHPVSMTALIITGATILAIIVTLAVYFINSSSNNTFQTRVYVVPPPANTSAAEQDKPSEPEKFHGQPALVYTPAPVSPEVLKLKKEPPPPPEDLLEYYRKVEERKKEEFMWGLEG